MRAPARRDLRDGPRQPARLDARARHARQLCAHAARAAAPLGPQGRLREAAGAPEGGAPAARRRARRRPGQGAAGASARDPARAAAAAAPPPSAPRPRCRRSRSSGAPRATFSTRSRTRAARRGRGQRRRGAAGERRVLGMARCAGVFLDAGANRGDTLFSWYRAPRASTGRVSKTRCRPQSATVAAIGSGRARLPLATRRTWCAESSRSQCQLYAPAAAGGRGAARRASGRSEHCRAHLHGGGRTRRRRAPRRRRRPRGGQLAPAAAARHGLGRARGLGAPVGRITQRVRVVDAVRVVADLGARGVPVALKLDIEGTEYDVLRDLVLTGLLCRHVQTLWVEFHRPAAPAPEAARRHWNGCCGRTMRRGRRFSASGCRWRASAAPRPCCAGTEISRIAAHEKQSANDGPPQLVKAVARRRAAAATRRRRPRRCTRAL